MIPGKFLEYSSKTLLAAGFSPRFFSMAKEVEPGSDQNSTEASSDEDLFPGTARLTQQGDLAEQMEDGIRKFLLQKTQEAPQKRARLWQRNYRSIKDYEKSVASHRERFRQIIGAVDPRVASQAPELLASPIAYGKGTFDFLSKHLPQ